jgi:hypothetical protein
MATWEYRTLTYSDGWGHGDTIRAKDLALLNDLGADGWEIVPPWVMIFVLLKRPMTPAQ